MRRSLRPTVIKFGTFAAVMALLTASLFFIFGQYQTGSTNDYSAVFADASRLETGQSVRVAGMRVGTVGSVKLQPDKTVVVTFDAGPSVRMTTGTRAAVRYLNLVGDRYLELIDGPDGTPLPPGSQIPKERTSAALDLDLLLGGLKPVIRGLNPQDVNALSASLIQVFQGQGGTLQSLLSNTSGFTTALAEHNQTIQALIDNLRTLLATLSKEGDKFSGLGRRPADRCPIAPCGDRR
jgi:phospholipid/cholesterol/gamma-HCH transport system substrate-binding protein